MPDLDGTGLAIRAGLVLQQLGAHYDVSVLVVPLHGPTDRALPGNLRSVSSGGFHAVRAPVSLTPAALLGAARAVAHGGRPSHAPATHDTSFDGQVFEAVHLYRATTLPFAVPFLTRAGARFLDLDEVESATRTRMAGVCEQLDDQARARRLRIEASVFERVERDLLLAFDRVYVSSTRDRAELVAWPGRAQIRLLPNALPDGPDPGDAPSTDPFTFLFVGTLAYGANADAVAFFCRAVFPVLRQRTRRPVRLVVVGAGASEDLRALSAEPGVEIRGFVPSLASVYRDAHAVVVPLRMGGGTRLKVIEAMRARRPIVSTSEGVAGIDLRADEHALIADDPGEFASQCARLIQEPELGTRLARAAHAVYVRDHRPEAMTAPLAPDPPS